ncbi:MAG: translation elongation factor 4, partial [Spirochaetia bacterium]
VLEISAKNNIGIDELLEDMIKRIPPPTGNPDGPLEALIFDSHYDAYRGVVVHVRIFQGSVRTGEEVRFWFSNASYNAEEVGRFKILLEKTDILHVGEVGYLIAGIKNISDIRVGDTMTSHKRPCRRALPGFREIKPVVFSSIYPVDTDDYPDLLKAVEKLKLNDASLVYDKDSSAALGFGFRCGFLGLLHLEVVQARLEREFDLSIVLTAPSVAYRIILKDGVETTINSPMDYPGPTEIEHAEEPYIRASIIVPSEYLGNVMTLCMEKRGIQDSMVYLDEKRVEIVYFMPLAEVLFEFYDRLKSVSRGYASFDYEVSDYRSVHLVRLDILLNGKPVDALAQLVFRDNAAVRAKLICEKLREEIPRHQFKIPIQGSIGSQIIARETIPALRKDVTAKCYGGDISRKRKLIEKQKAGKKRMKMVGNVELPQTAFLSVLKAKDD